MDPRYHIAVFREVRLLMSGAQSARGVRTGAEACRGSPASRDLTGIQIALLGGVRTGDRVRSGHDCRDQGSAHHGAGRRRARAAADSRAAQRRIRMRKQRKQAHRADQFDRDRSDAPRIGGIDSDEDEIETLTIDPGGRHIGELVPTAMRAVRHQETEDKSFRPVCASLRQTSSKDRDGVGAAVEKTPTFTW